MIKLAFLLVIFVVYIIIVAIAQFFNVLASGVKAAANGIQNYKNNNDFGNQITTNDNSLADKFGEAVNLVFFFGEVLKIVQEYANRYEMVKKSGENIEKSMAIYEIICTEIYIYILILLVGDFQSKKYYNIAMVINFGLKTIDDYLMSDIDKSNLFEILNLRLNTYSECSKLTSSLPGYGNLIFAQGYHIDCLEKYIEIDIRSYNINKKFNEKEVFQMNYKLEYTHNLETIMPEIIKEVTVKFKECII